MTVSQDPAVSSTISTCVLSVGRAFVPGLERSLGHIQDADTALLGVHSSQRLTGISEAMGHHRKAALPLVRFLEAGRR